MPLPIVPFLAAAASVFAAVQTALPSKLIEAFDDYLTQVQLGNQTFSDYVESNVYLTKNYAPTNATTAPLSVDVAFGDVPDDLEGLFVRNGPNDNIDIKRKKLYHWFDGNGMIHSLRFKRGQPPLYSSSYIPTEYFLHEQELGRQYWIRLGELRGFSGLLKILVVSPIKLWLLDRKRRKERKGKLNILRLGQANTHTVMVGSRIFATHEASLPFEIVVDDLGVIKGGSYSDFGGLLDFPVSAHPKVDKQKDALVFHSYGASSEHLKNSGGSPLKVGEVSVRYVEDNETGSVLYYEGVPINSSRVPFSHDLFITENYAIVIDSSSHFKVEAMFGKDEKTRQFFQFDENYKLRLGLFPRKEGGAQQVRWFEYPSAAAILHSLNAWEEGDEIVMWAPVALAFDSSLSDGDNIFRMSEIRLNLETGELNTRRIDNSINAEFPRVRDECNGILCKYGFAGIMDGNLVGGGGVFRGYTKWNMEAKALECSVEFKINDEQYAGGEPVVIPKAGKSQSDDVYIGTFVTHPARIAEQYFVVFDGKSCETEPTLVLEMPVRVPFGFHGNWFSEEQLQRHIAARPHE